MDALERTGKTAAIAALTVQGYCPECDKAGVPYGGRFFSAVVDPAPFDAAILDWISRASSDLDEYWPRSEIPFGHMTHQRQPLPQHGYTHWWKMFNPRQLLVHAQLLKAIVTAGGDQHSWDVRELVLGAYQQYLRNQNMFCFWNPQRDTPEPMFSQNNYHPKATVVENSVFPVLGRGNWRSGDESLFETLNWSGTPWELVDAGRDPRASVLMNERAIGKSIKVACGDPVLDGVTLECGSATDLSGVAESSYDLVITDPPFGGLLHYSELADFFYVWLRLVLKNRYPDIFSAEYTPKALEVVANKARQPEDPDGFYQRLLTESWRQACRILKPGGILAFTFHHNEDAPWVRVLESLFDAGFYLEATYPIRSDETKGEGEFGSKKIEYDIIHVCRKRTKQPEPVSWARMRREVLQDIRHLQSLLENHRKEGLPSADMQVIRRGKALEYYSRHYGKVYVDDGRPFGVREALLGINQVLDEESGRKQEPPPVMAEPFTRQFLRIFDGQLEQAQDQVQKYLRGTGIPAEELVERGWCTRDKKIYRLVPSVEIARIWHGRHRRNMVSDYDQAMFLIGACYGGSGINVSDTLNNENFRPHPALGALLEWHVRKSVMQEERNAASRALAIFRSWEQSHVDEVKQLSLFYGE